MKRAQTREIPTFFNQLAVLGDQLLDRKPHLDFCHCIHWNEIIGDKEGKEYKDETTSFVASALFAQLRFRHEPPRQPIPQHAVFGQAAAGWHAPEEEDGIAAQISQARNVFSIEQRVQFGLGNFEDIPGCLMSAQRDEFLTEANPARIEPAREREAERVILNGKTELRDVLRRKQNLIAPQ